MSKPEETTAPTPAAEDEDPAVRFAKFMAEPMPPFVPRSKRRKALRIEVSQRTFDAVKANPSELKLLAKDANGNPVVERPARPRMTYAEAAAWNARVRALKLGPRRSSTGGGKTPAHRPEINTGRRNELGQARPATAPTMVHAILSSRTNMTSSTFCGRTSDDRERGRTKKRIVPSEAGELSQEEAAQAA